MKRRERAAGTIVLATDFLKPSQRAFAYAIALAKVLQVRLVILHVIRGVTGAGSPAPSDSRYLKPMKTAALLELARLVRLAQDAGIRAEASLQIGHPAVSVPDAIRKLRAQMIVMGTHGRTGWDRLQLGSTAESVIRVATCPAMTVRGVVAGDAAKPHSHVRLLRLLVATDFSVTAQGAVRWAARLAQQVGASLVVLHAVETPTPGRRKWSSRMSVDLDALRTARTRRLERVVSELVEKGVAAEAACVDGIPIEVIVAQAAQWGADAIIIGTHGRRGLRRAVLGSLAEQVVRRAGCPVVTVNPSAGRWGS